MGTSCGDWELMEWECLLVAAISPAVDVLRSEVGVGGRTRVEEEVVEVEEEAEKEEVVEAGWESRGFELAAVMSGMGWAGAEVGGVVVVLELRLSGRPGTEMAGE